MNIKKFILKRLGSSFSPLIDLEKQSSEPKIITRIFGGLGNQLFCYAAARRLALVNNAELVIDDISGFVNDSQYNRHYQLDHFLIPCRKATDFERMEPFSLLRRFIKRKLNLLVPFTQRNYIQQEDIDFDSRLLHFKVSGTVYIEGYWQSEDYFKDVAITLREELKIKPPFDATNLEMAENIRGCKSVAVHVRFFDQPQIDGINCVPSDYYSRAIALMESLVPYAHYYIFSDKPEASQARIPLPAERYTMVAHNLGDELAYADLWLMTQCKHFIIANSTFSWWGAWLAECKDTLVISPASVNGMLTAWGFPGNLPSRWNLL